MTDAELTIFMIEVFLIGLGLGAVIISLYKWGFRVWDYFYRGYNNITIKVGLMELPSIMDSSFLVGASLILVAIWTENMKFLYSGLWLMGMTLFAYMGRREEE